MNVRDPEHYTPEDEDEVRDEDRSFNGSVEDLARVFDEYAALGIDHLVVDLVPLTEASLDRLAGAVALRSGSR